MVTRTPFCRCLIAFSLALNIGFCSYFAVGAMTPSSPHRSLEERMQVYLQYLPESARAPYREHINAKLATLMTLNKQQHSERQAIADLLAKDSLDQSALTLHFKTIRDLGQQISSIYQDALVEVEADMPLEERMKSHDLISGFLKRD